MAETVTSVFGGHIWVGASSSRPRARRRSASQGAPYGARSVDNLVQPLFVKITARRHHGGRSELARRTSRFVVVKGFVGRPPGHDREVVRMRGGLLVDVVAQYALLLCARFGEPPDRGLGEIGEHRQEVDMLHHVERTAGPFGPRRTG